MDAAGLDYSTQGSTDYILYAEVDEEPVMFNSAEQGLAEWGSANAGDLSERIGG